MAQRRSPEPPETEQEPHIARAHVLRWGDGAEHLHVFIYARPAGFPQLRGSCFAIWDDLLPPADLAMRAADAAALATALVRSYGGSAEPPLDVTPTDDPGT